MREKSERNGYLQKKYHLYGMLNVDLVRVFFHNTQPLSLFMQWFSIYLGQKAILKRMWWYLEWFLVQASLNFDPIVDDLQQLNNGILILDGSWYGNKALYRMPFLSLAPHFGEWYRTVALKSITAENQEPF